MAGPVEARLAGEEGVAVGPGRELRVPADARHLAEALGVGELVAVDGLAGVVGDVVGLALEGEGVSERYLTLLVATYTAMADFGAPAPIPWLARLIGRRPETVKDHLKRARRDGFLTTVAGKAGGELTDKAKAVLEEMAEAGSQGG